MNLLRNAEKAVREQAAPKVRIETEAHASGVDIRVADNGPGLLGQDLSALEEPFFSTRSSGEGMGLGLFIAKTLLERSGAELKFANGSDPYQSLTDTPDRKGAIVKVAWPRKMIDAQTGDTPVPSGANQQFTV